MGASFTNLQIRNSSTKAIGSLFPKLTDSRAYISPDHNGWVTVYAEATEDQNDETMRTVAKGISKSLKTDVLGFLVHDSDIAMYWLFRNGTLADEFNSAPDYLGEEVDEETRTRLRGSTDALLPICLPGTTREQIEVVIHPIDEFPLMAEEIVADLAKLLGIDDARVGLGFEYFDAEAEEILPDADKFTPIGNAPKRKKSQISKAPDHPAGPVFDMFSMAIGMLTKCWDGEQEKMAETFGKMLAATGQKSDGLLKKLRSQLDRGAKDMLKQSQLTDCPTFEELKAARDAGPDALAELIVNRVPSQLGSIADGAIQSKLEAFVSALLARGMDPNTKNQHNQSLYDVAQRHGNAAICQLFKSALGKSR